MEMIAVPKRFNWQENTFGWNPLNEHAEKTDSYYPRSLSERSFIWYVNIANTAAAIVSPLVGIIRMVVAAILLYQNSQVKNADDRLGPMETQYLWAQMARGAFETVGGGYVFWIPDLIITGYRVYKGDYPYIAKALAGDPNRRFTVDKEAI